MLYSFDLFLIPNMYSSQPLSMEGGKLVNTWFDRKELSYEATVEREEVDRTLETILKIVADLEQEVHNLSLYGLFYICRRMIYETLKVCNSILCS